MCWSDCPDLLFAYDIRHIFSWPGSFIMTVIIYNDCINYVVRVVVGANDIYEPVHDKTNKMIYVRPPKTQISLDISPVRSESSLSVWRTMGPRLPIERTAKTLIRLGGCPGWSESSQGVYDVTLVQTLRLIILDFLPGNPSRVIVACILMQ